MGTHEELQAFLVTNKLAWMFASKALDDYLLARLGIQCTLFSGFEMATQAVEKLLKSYLLFRDTSLGDSSDKVRDVVAKRSKALGRAHELGHDVEAALDLAARLGLPHSSDLGRRIARINAYYARRYPNGDGPTSLSGEELHDIDEAVFEVWDAFKDINIDYYHVTGLMTHAYGVHLHMYRERPVPQFSRSWFEIMTRSNQSWAVRKHELEQGIKTVLSRWYPSVNTARG